MTVLALLLAGFTPSFRIPGFSPPPQRQEPEKDVGEYQVGTKDQKTTSLGQVSEEPLEFRTKDPVTATDAWTTLIEALGATSRTVVIKVPVSAANGIFYRYDGDEDEPGQNDPKFPIEPGELEVITTVQKIEVIRDGDSNVTVYLQEGQVV